jgi:hypothetical protein
VVSKQSLEEWLARNQTHLPQPNDEAEVPEEISTSAILCEHGALDPAQAGRMKCINEVSVESVARASELNRSVRVLTRKSWLWDASSRRCSTLTTSVQSASYRRIKVRDLRQTERCLGTYPHNLQKNATSKSTPAWSPLLMRSATWPWTSPDSGCQNHG